MSFQSSDELQPPQGRRKSGTGGGMNNQGYVHTEPTPLVLPVGSPPPLPLSHAIAEPGMASPSPSIMGAPSTITQGRRHSMVVQLNLQQGAAPQVAGVPPSRNGRSVSMLSLNGTQHVSSMYPNLHNDTQSIYSEVGYGVTSHPVGSTGPHSNAAIKVVEGQQTSLIAGHPEAVSTHPDPHDPHLPPQPTEEGEKKAWFQHTLSKNMSIMYAVFLVMLGIVIYLADTFSGHDSAIAESFNVFLIVAQLLWLFYVHVDVRRYVNLISRALDEAKTKQINKDEQVQLEPTGDGQYQLRINVPEAPKTIPQYYGFTSGRHGGSLYLKIGATGTTLSLKSFVNICKNIAKSVLNVISRVPLNM